MELIYLWVEEFKSLKNAEFNFNPKYKISFKNKFLNFEENTEYQSVNKFWNDDILNFTAIVGQNGTGKTSLMQFIAKGLGNFEYNHIFVLIDNGKMLVYYNSFIENFKPKFHNKFNLNIFYSYAISNTAIIYYSSTFTNEDTIFDDGKFMFKSDVSNQQILKKNELNTLYRDEKYKFKATNEFWLDEIERVFTFLKDKPYLSNQIHTEIGLDLLKTGLNNIKIEVTLYPDWGCQNLFSLNSIIFKQAAESPTLNETTKKQSQRFLLNLSFDLIAVIIHDLSSLYFSTITNSENDNSIHKILDVLFKNGTTKMDFIAELKKVNIEKGEEFSEKLLLILEYYTNYDNYELYIASVKKLFKQLEYIGLFDLFVFFETNIRFIKITYKKEADKFSIIISQEVFNSFISIYRFVLSKLSYQKRFININWGLSSGELSIMNIFTRLNFSISDIKAKLEQHWKFSSPTIEKEEISTYYIIIDEIDLYLHPEWQRKLVYILNKYLPMLFDGKKIQVIVSTHSPIILADFPGEHVIYLGTDADFEKPKTFAENIYTLYKNSLFLSDSTGEFAKEKIQEIVKFHTKVKETENESEPSKSESLKQLTEKYLENNLKFHQTTEFVGDDFIRNNLKYMLANIEKSLYSESKYVESQKERLEAEKFRIEQELKKLNHD